MDIIQMVFRNVHVLFGYVRDEPHFESGWVSTQRKKGPFVFQHQKAAI